MKLSVDSKFPHPSGDELGVLRTEIENDDEFGMMNEMINRWSFFVLCYERLDALKNTKLFKELPEG